MFTLAREIDFSYKTNKWITIASLVVAVLGAIITQSAKSGLYIGLGTFLTWAIAREVDPKHEYSAFFAAGISLVNLFYFQKIEILNIFYILLFLRLVNGISGKKASLLDIFIVFALGLLLTLDKKNSIYLIPFISGVMSIKRIEGKNKIIQGILIITSLIFLVESLAYGYFGFKEIDFSNIMNISIVVASFIFIIWNNFIKIEGTLDDKGEPVNDKKIRSSQMLYGSTILLFFLFADISLNNLIIYFSVMFGIIVYSLVGEKLEGKFK